MARLVKEEQATSSRTKIVDGAGMGMKWQEATGRKVLRSRYLAVKNLISDESNDICHRDSKRFKSIISEVEALHENVHKPREQVADAETLLKIVHAFAKSVRSQISNGVTPSDFVTSILKNFKHYEHKMPDVQSGIMVSWSDIGYTVPHLFHSVSGCCTMVGPMQIEIKQRKHSVCRRWKSPTESTRPQQIDQNEQETKTDTAKNMSIMFEILKKKKTVNLENLILNRGSFAQTVENIFALSFLVKDGRAEIKIDDNGYHLVSPRNAPTASAVASGNVSYHHFVLRFDYKDWKLMMNAVKSEEELMPHRTNAVQKLVHHAHKSESDLKNKA